MLRTSHGCAVLNLGGREVVVVAGGQVGLDYDNDVDEANDNGEDSDNDDYNERCIVTCLLQASQVLLFLITNRLVVKCFPQWSTSAWQRTITGRPCPLSRFQGSPNRLCKKTRFRRFRWKIVFVDCADDNDDCNVV